MSIFSDKFDEIRRGLTKQDTASLLRQKAIAGAHSHAADAIGYGMASGGYASGGVIGSGGSGTSSPSLIDKINLEVQRRQSLGGPVSAGGGSDPYGYYQGYPVTDLITVVDKRDRAKALAELMKMAFPIMPHTPPFLGGGGGAGGPGFAQAVYREPSVFDHVNALCMRMRWSSIHSTPFENVYVFVAAGKKIFIHIVTKELKTVTLEVEDDPLFPSDHLISELRTLGG